MTTVTCNMERHISPRKSWGEISFLASGSHYDFLVLCLWQWTWNHAFHTNPTSPCLSCSYKEGWLIIREHLLSMPHNEHWNHQTTLINNIILRGFVECKLMSHPAQGERFHCYATLPLPPSLILMLRSHYRRNQLICVVLKSATKPIIMGDTGHRLLCIDP